MVEHQPSKLDTWVRFPSLALVQGYRSGHNEAVLKTVCPQGRVGSNPTLSALFVILSEDALWAMFSAWRSTQEAEGTPLERAQVG